MAQDILGEKIAAAVEAAVKKIETKVIPVVEGDRIRCKLSIMEGSPETDAVVKGTYKSFRGAVKVLLPNNNWAFIDPRCVLKVM
ncbi:MAG: hypothetical protein EHM49_00585 [Deltaproteobacteria bacterium]|nr:MAG: hypothetical protein EHM49_00585 [Deltaproteobacteria bacterium]